MASRPPGCLVIQSSRLLHGAAAAEALEKDLEILDGKAGPLQDHLVQLLQFREVHVKNLAAAGADHVIVLVGAAVEAVSWDKIFLLLLQNLGTF